MYRRLTLFILAGLMISCIDDYMLPLPELDEKPSYFIECYLVPNENYKVSATKLQAINEDYILDYSLEFDVKIDHVSLIHGLFKDESGEYLYNYGHWYLFRPDRYENKTVSLNVVTPENEVIKGSTTIPDAIKIESYEIVGNQMVTRFKSSKDPWHNYYINVIKYNDIDTIYPTVKYFDLSHLEPNESTAINVAIPYENYDALSNILLRVTEENYKYQLSLNNAKDSNKDNLVQPTVLIGNLENSAGIFTCYTVDSVQIKVDRN